MLISHKGIKALALLSLFFVSGIILSEFVSAESTPSVQINKTKEIGNYLSDSKGMTLYYFKKDSPGKSTCAGDCLEKWPVFFTDELMISPELKHSDFGIITREDGKEQITYKGFPLYYYFKDKKPGDTLGNKIGDVWFVVDPDKFK